MVGLDSHSSPQNAHPRSHNMTEFTLPEVKEAQMHSSAASLFDTPSQTTKHPFPPPLPPPFRGTEFFPEAYTNK